MFDSAEALRYLANGLAATAIHYGVLWAGIELIGIPSAGLTSAVASVIASAVSFVGNRWFVFDARHTPATAHIARFAVVYVLIALLHGGFLLAWADYLRLDYRLGFAMALAIATVVGYQLNRHFVFRKREGQG